MEFFFANLPVKFGIYDVYSMHCVGIFVCSWFCWIIFCWFTSAEQCCLTWESYERMCFKSHSLKPTIPAGCRIFVYRDIIFISCWRTKASEFILLTYLRRKHCIFLYILWNIAYWNDFALNIFICGSDSISCVKLFSKFSNKLCICATRVFSSYLY